MKRHPVGIALDYVFNKCGSCADRMFIARGIMLHYISVGAMKQKCYFLETLMRKHQLVYNSILTRFDT